MPKGFILYYLTKNVGHTTYRQHRRKGLLSGKQLNTFMFKKTNVMPSKSTRINILYYKPCYLEFADIFQNPLRRGNTNVIHEYFHSKEVTCC